jgi:hypothetical protein
MQHKLYGLFTYYNKHDHKNNLFLSGILGVRNAYKNDENSGKL